MAFLPKFIFASSYACSILHTTFCPRPGRFFCFTQSVQDGINLLSLLHPSAVTRGQAPIATDVLSHISQFDNSCWITQSQIYYAVLPRLNLIKLHKGVLDQQQATENILNRHLCEGIRPTGNQSTLCGY